jgi:hypothetical protein
VKTFNPVLSTVDISGSHRPILIENRAELKIRVGSQPMGENHHPTLAEPSENMSPEQFKIVKLMLQT